MCFDGIAAEPSLLIISNRGFTLTSEAPVLLEGSGVVMEQARPLSKHIVQYSGAYSFCAGCNSCEALCSLVHDGVVSPSYSRVFLQRGGTRDMVCHIASCQQCVDHPCYEACSKKDQAMRIDNDNGIVYVSEADCIGCGLCVKACVFEPARINLTAAYKRKERKAKKCDLCRTRASGPACVEYCPVRCLGISTQAEGQVVDPESTKAVKLSVF